MNRIIISFVALFSFVAISCGNANPSNSEVKQGTEQSIGTFKNVSVTDLNTAISEGGNFVVMDVRTPGEVAEGHIEGAEKIDINNASFKSKAAELDKNETVYVYCRSGHRSQTASKALISMGFTDVRNVEGGFLAWSQKGYKSVK